MSFSPFEMLEGAKSIGAGAATIASAGAAVGIGNVFSSLIHYVARNPSLAKQLFGYTLLGLIPCLLCVEVRKVGLTSLVVGAILKEFRAKD
ncbi:hypothetical protein RYX36_028849 [Vicia faba]